MHNWFVFDEFEQASRAAAEFIVDKMIEFIAQNGLCHVALPGGNTPALCLSYVAEKSLPWEKIHWYLGDERCYPAGHAERNDVMLDNQLWSRIKPATIHRIPAELGPEKAAAFYRNVIDRLECIDIAFLGVGEDGHTASLFPDNKALADTDSVVPVFNSPKAPDQRVSLSLSTLNNARVRVVLASGKGKASIINRIKQHEALPINQIGDINWFIDSAAATL